MCLGAICVANCIEALWLALRRLQCFEIGKCYQPNIRCKGVRQSCFDSDDWMLVVRDRRKYKRPLGSGTLGYMVKHKSASGGCLGS